MTKLGKIEKISDLRTIWKHEAYNFSKWLAEEENLQFLSESIGIDLVLDEVESSVGSFNVDILATEEGSGRKVIIENQLEDTNHDHLGKIVTYASGKDAKVIIWIVKRARDEHRQAVEWLNQHTDEEIGFFLLEIELWRIGNSDPAPKFNVVVQPNAWAKAEKKKEGLSDVKKLQLEYWQAFCKHAFQDSNFASNFSERKSNPQHWYDLSVGNSSCHICLSVDTQKKKINVDIYIPDDKLLYEKFESQKEAIEKELGSRLIWRNNSNKKSSRILIETNGDIQATPEKWKDLFEWQMNKAMQFREIVKKYAK